MKSLDVKINFENGLHSRPALKIVDISRKCNSVITIIHNSKTINTKSIIAILSAGIKQGETITINIDGSDEEIVYEELKNCLEFNCII